VSIQRPPRLQPRSHTSDRRPPSVEKRLPSSEQNQPPLDENRRPRSLERHTPTIQRPRPRSLDRRPPSLERRVPSLTRRSLSVERAATATGAAPTSASANSPTMFHSTRVSTRPKPRLASTPPARTNQPFSPSGGQHNLSKSSPRNSSRKLFGTQRATVRESMRRLLPSPERHDSATLLRPTPLRPSARSVRGGLTTNSSRKSSSSSHSPQRSPQRNPRAPYDDKDSSSHNINDASVPTEEKKLLRQQQ
jgi:hypothetical protein